VIAIRRFRRSRWSGFGDRDRVNFAGARLAPLALDETRDYLRLRLDAAGARGQPIFDDDAIAAVFDAGAGVPRRLNRIASAALIVAASRKKTIVAAQDVHDARIDRCRA
jgi:general secretion pathway protein A